MVWEKHLCMIVSEVSCSCPCSVYIHNGHTVAGEGDTTVHNATLPPYLCLLHIIAVGCFACSPVYFGKCSFLYFGLDKCLTSIFLIPLFSVSVFLIQEFSSASVASLSVMTRTVSPATNALRELITSQTMRRRSPLAVTMRLCVSFVCAMEHWILPA